MCERHGAGDTWPTRVCTMGEREPWGLCADGAGGVRVECGGVRVECGAWVNGSLCTRCVRCLHMGGWYCLMGFKWYC